MPQPITVSDLVDYLQQFDGDDPVVLRTDDVEDEEVCLEVALDAMLDHRDDQDGSDDDMDDDR